MTHITSTLTAKNRDQLRNPNANPIVYGLPLPFYIRVTLQTYSTLPHRKAHLSLCVAGRIGIYADVLHIHVHSDIKYETDHTEDLAKPHYTNVAQRYM